ncbi:hypothetical protein ACI78Q_10005 [Geodermatophilus sp. SYSU D00705]
MNRWVQRGLRTALLTGGLLAAGAGVAAADENDLTADLLGATVTVPVQDGAVLGTPVVTGTGEDLAVGTGTGDDLRLPVDTNTAPGTTVLGDGGVSVPVRVTEADDRLPDPADGLTVTVPVNTSGGGTAGTTITVPIVTGDLGDVLDGDPLTGADVDVDLTDPVTAGPGGDGLLLDLRDTVTIGDTDGATTPDTVLELPAGLDGDRPSTVTLPLPSATGDLLPGLLGGDGEGHQHGDGSDQPGDGSEQPGDGSEQSGDGAGRPGGGSGDGGTAAGTAAGSTAAPSLDGSTAADADGDCSGAAGRTVPAAGSSGTGSTTGTGSATGSPTGPGTGGSTGSADTGGPDAEGPSTGGTDADGTGTGDACGTGTPQAVATRSATSPATAAGPATVTAGVLALLAGLLLTVPRGRRARHRA